LARIDDLIAQVPDAKLQAQLAHAFAESGRRKRFGLVYEEHLPEVTTLLGVSIRIGQLVQRRDDAKGTTYRVKTVSPTDAVIEVVESGETESVKPDQLMVVKRFGEPIYPILTSLRQEVRSATRPAHAVINGENFHALQLLVYLYEGKVDCIYLDPPYNTGARDWKYNNAYVDQKDRWRHSKWLAMIERRLKIARRLLKPDSGVLIVTIDEHEVHHLGMLLERLFPDYLRHMITIVINPKGTGKYNFARVDEYAFFCVPDVGRTIIAGTPKNPLAESHDNGTGEPEESDGEEEDEPSLGMEIPEEEEEWDRPFPKEESHLWELRHARRRGNESSYRHQRRNQFYPIYLDEAEKRIVGVGKSVSIDELPLDAPPAEQKRGNVRAIWPIDEEGNHRCWRFVPTTMANLVRERRVVLGRFNKARKTWTLNIWERSTPTKKLKTVWNEKSLYDAGTHGTSLLHKMLGRRDAFPFPKSVYAVRDCLAAVVRNIPDALIVDFFAGSGTTLHATALLNAADGGARRTILVTNNEVQATVARKLNKQGLFRGDPEFESHGIFEQATLPRCVAAVTGKRSDGRPIVGAYDGGRPMAQGFDENVHFFRLDYADPDEVELGREYKSIQPLLWLAAGATGAIPTHSGTGVHSLICATNRFAILFNEAHFSPFKSEILGWGLTHVFLVTDSEEAYSEMTSRLPKGLATAMLYRDYLRSFRVNTERIS